MGILSEYAIDLILKDRLDEAEHILLAESVEEKILKSIGETTMMDYLIKFEQFLDDADIYLKSGWEDAVIIQSPEVQNFWCIFWLQTTPKTDIRWAKRLCNNENAQNDIKVKEMDDGSHVLRFKILRRLLDKIEVRNKDRAITIANREDPTGVSPESQPE